VASWKLGYPNGLDSVANEAAGIALYNAWSVSALTLSTKTTTTRFGGQVTAIAETILTDTGSFDVDQYNGGFVKILSGSAKGTAYKVTDGDTNTLTVKTMKNEAATMVTDGVAVNDYYEVITGSTAFEFPSNRNPVRKDIKIVPVGKYKRFKLYEGGINISQGRNPDDLVILGYLTSESDLVELLRLLNLKMDYAGYDGTYTQHNLAPLILEMGTHDADHQYLVHHLDVKYIGAGKKGSIIEVMMHFQQTGIISYRGN
jgi:hypothetical protein